MWRPWRGGSGEGDENRGLFSDLNIANASPSQGRGFTLHFLFRDWGSRSFSNCIASLPLQRGCELAASRVVSSCWWQVGKLSLDKPANMGQDEHFQGGRWWAFHHDKSADSRWHQMLKVGGNHQQLGGQLPGKGPKYRLSKHF